MIHLLLVWCHEAYPFPLFLMLLDHSLKERILAAVVVCTSRFDNYTREFLRKYSPDICSVVALLELAIVVMLGRTSTTRLEALNAKLRKIMHAKSNMTKKPDLTILSSEFLLAKLRSLHRGLWQRIWRGSVKRTGAQHVDGKRRRRATRRRRVRKHKTRKFKAQSCGGGAWRAFIHKRCAGVCKAAFRDLAIEYRGLSQEERAELVAEGASACASHRLGRKSFGLTARELARATCGREILDRVRRACESGMQLPVETRVAAVSSDALDAELKTLTADRSVLKFLENVEGEEQAERVADWHVTEGARRRDNMITDLPMFADQRSPII